MLICVKKTAYFEDVVLIVYNFLLLFLRLFFDGFRRRNFLFFLLLFLYFLCSVGISGLPFLWSHWCLSDNGEILCFLRAIFGFNRLTGHSYALLRLFWLPFLLFLNSILGVFCFLGHEVIFIMQESQYSGCYNTLTDKYGQHHQ